METFRDLLPYFGITRVQDEQGQLAWTIDVVTDGSDASYTTARLDNIKGVWKLSDAPKSHPSLPSPPASKGEQDHAQVTTPHPDSDVTPLRRASTREIAQKREQFLVTELDETERRISRLAEVVPVGIYELAPDGSLLWANSKFFDIFDILEEDRKFGPFDWKDYILPDDHEQASVELARCLSEGDPVTDSLRLKRQYDAPQESQGFFQNKEPAWVMYSAIPNIATDGSVRSLTGSLTDISRLKWAEKLHDRNAEIARREKQIQEEFIDITSHEMRNPLSAITQCADSIILSQELSRDDTSAESLWEVLKVHVEAAESILFCAAHQKRIIDDVLTLGKLDSNLLAISPSTFQPQELVDQTMQMFRAEMEANAIEVRIHANESTLLNGHSSVRGDLSRLMQILVNLMTNAIKFTKLQKTKKITVQFGLSMAVPSQTLFGPDFRWHSTGTSRPDLTLNPDYGQGDVVYLYYAVTDTGRGIAPEFIDKVFTKFEQADRRTHTTYGGSGLGLYISQELTELQGGLIGIESKHEVGSTFAFYTKVRCAEVGPINGATHDAAKKSIGVSIRAPKLPSRTNWTILFVEDNILNQRILATQLRRAGCTVQVCNNGGEAIDTVLHMYDQPSEYGTAPSKDKLPRFDCILMDWEMPVVNGLGATKRIRQIEAEQAGPKNIIIGVTANARREQIAKAMDAGMDTVMPKPFRVAELLIKISQLCG
ncbi:hypothetical protein ACN47E_007985 [Coniothyrium glycines]